MPPALSDDESSASERIPPQRKGKQPPQNQGGSSDEDRDGEDDEGADEYVVEKVIAHKFVKGRLVFDVKWQGYDDPKDRTWEPEENMEGAIDVMQEYFDEIGGRPEAPGQKRKARASASSKPESGTQALAKRVKQEKEWSPPPGSWEHDVKFVDTIEESTDPRTGELGRFAYLVWNNDKKTQHPLKHVNLKCPQKMLQYYESHLVFTQNDSVNGSGVN